MSIIRQLFLFTKIDQYRNVQGLILNRTTGNNVSEFSIELDNFRFPVRDGGVYEQGELSVLHTKGNVIPDSKQLFPGVCVDGDLDELSYWLMLGQVDLSELLFVSGYCSWTADELKQRCVDTNGMSQMQQWILFSTIGHMNSGGKSSVHSANISMLWQIMLKHSQLTMSSFFIGMI